MTKTIERITPLALHESMITWQRVAAYARASSGKDTMLHSLSAQVSKYSAEIQQHKGWQYAGVYADEAYTGTRANRPEFQRLLEDCRAGKIDIIITKSVSRFARNTLTLLSVLRELTDLGIAVFFERENIWSNSGDGELMLTILASYAQEESRSVSENCKWRIRKGFENGQPYGVFSLYGYRIKHGEFHIVPEEAAVIREIFSDYLSGMGVEAIMKKLRARGIKSGRHCIKGALRNEKYIGDLLLQKTFVADHLTKRQAVNRGQLPMFLIEDHHDAIIDRNTFARVQTEILWRAKKYQPSPATPPVYPFSSMIRCGFCGERYRRKITAAGTKYEKPVWICTTFNVYGKGTCSSQQIPESVLMQQTAIALGMKEFDAAALTVQVSEIRVPGANRLDFIFKDSHEVQLTWQTSRRDSWTPEMRQQASKDALRGHSMARARLAKGGAAQ